MDLTCLQAPSTWCSYPLLFVGNIHSTVYLEKGKRGNYWIFDCVWVKAHLLMISLKNNVNEIADGILAWEKYQIQAFPYMQ